MKNAAFQFGRRPWLACALIAFALRFAAALVTERWEIFPSYYYTDARIIEKVGREMAENWRPGLPVPAPPSQRAYGLVVAASYRLFGPHPLVSKTAGALAGALAVGALVAFLGVPFGPAAASLTGLVVAACPSFIFYSSQTFKDPFIVLFGTIALGLAMRRLADPGPSWLELAVLWGAVVAAGLMRPHVMIVLAGAIAFGAAWMALRRAKDRRPAALLLAAALAAPASYVPLSRALFTKVLPSPPGGEASAEAGLVPVAVERGGVSELTQPFTPDNIEELKRVRRDPVRDVRPYTPLGISEFRRIRQDEDRVWARRNGARDIGTQIFYGARFESWIDVLLFLPKGAFYASFMPLPGLYPIENKLGRLAASLENAAMLALALLALYGIRRSRLDAARAVPLCFFLAMTAVSGLFEVDLGSATRHRTLQFSMLLPFAFLRRDQPAL